MIGWPYRAPRLFGAFVLTAVLASAGPPAWAAAPADLELRPPNLKPAPKSVEAGMWDDSDRAEAHTRIAAELDTDPALQAYVRGVFCKIAADYCGEARVYVLDRPFLNATCFPNGYVEVWSGLLLRAQTEGQLAYVVGHEVSHFARNHSLSKWNHDKTTRDVATVLTVGVQAGAMFGMVKVAQSGAPNSRQMIDDISDMAQNLNDLIYLGAMAHIMAYSREHENEADRLGFQRAVAAGYEKSTGPDMWTGTIAESRASDFAAVRKADVRASIYRTHPLDQDRIDALKAQGGVVAAPDIDARKRYRAAIRGHLGSWLKDDLRRRDDGQTLFLIDRLSEVGEDFGVLQFYRGEAYRQRRHDGDAPLALAAYKTAVGYPDAPVAAWRELGEALRRAGDKPAAAEAFETYLAKAPDAEDRWLVEASLKTVKGA